MNFQTANDFDKRYLTKQSQSRDVLPFACRLGCRMYQKALYCALPFLPYRNPKILYSVNEIASDLKSQNIQRVFVLTDPILEKSEKFQTMIRSLEAEKIVSIIFTESKPNPTIQLAEAVARLYRKNRAQGLLAFGGGSVIDLAKAVGAKISRPKKSLQKMAGILGVLKRIPYLIAVPTTCGTGSEATLAAVLIDETSHHKFAINDFPLIPGTAVLDAEIIHELPAALVAQTGMDALCHAVEAYIGQSTTKQTRMWAEEAVRLIVENLDDCVAHKSQLAEQNMLIASHLAGKAFTRSYVGSIHALSHALSGLYGVPHGKTNAILMPLVLKEYGQTIVPKMADLARAAGIGFQTDTDTQLCTSFISWMEEENARYGFGTAIEQLRTEDIGLLTEYAFHEIHPLYPVPVLWNRSKLSEIYSRLLPEHKEKKNVES